MVISCFNPVRREIARLALTRLIADGRIHPTRIEEIVAKVGQEMEETILRSDLKELTGSGLSLMPEGLEAGLQPQALADLIAYIKSANY